MSLTDSRKMWVLLRDSAEKGCHSHDLRALGVSGNPSQRAKDIASHDVSIWTAREARNGRPGSRWWLAEHAPDWAIPVKPNNDTGRSGGPSPDPAAASNAVCWTRDYTKPGEWQLLPLDEALA